MQKIFTQRFRILLGNNPKSYSFGLAFLLFFILAIAVSTTVVKGKPIINNKIINTAGKKTSKSLVSFGSAVTRNSVVADNPQPKLDSLSKYCITQGFQGDLRVTLYGENFVQGAEVRISYSGFRVDDFTPTSVSANGKQIESEVPANWLLLFQFFPGQYRIQVVNPAPAVQGGVSNEKIFTVYAFANTGNISGKTVVCTSETQVVYSVPPVAGASYIWGLPPGATIVGSSGGNQITVNFTNAASGDVSVTGISGCGDVGATSTLAVTVNSPPVIDKISSSVPVCLNDATTLTVNALGSNLNYKWFKRAGSATSNGFPLTDGGTLSGSNSATLKISKAAAADAGYYYVVVSNTCNPGGTASTNVQIIVNPGYTNTIQNVQEPAELLIDSSATYSVTPNNNSLAWRYTWTIFYNTSPASSETFSTGTTPTFTIPRVRPDMSGIRITQLPPPGTLCVEAINNVVDILSAPLPVELIYLKATKQNNDVVEVEWATAMEKNSEGFEVQVSQDAQNYRTLAFVASKAGGNTNQKQVYTFHDKENGKYGTRYYRLMQRDMNGDSEYFGPKAVLIGEAAESLSVYPNPFSNEVTLQLNAEEAGTMHVLVTNAIGSKVLERTLNIQKGSNKQSLQFKADLPLGMYHITTRLNGKTRHIKLLKQ
ncbi:MAG: T9SS type A sorting domain-containing protein [Adhaeribacter sp.]